MQLKIKSPRKKVQLVELSSRLPNYTERNLEGMLYSLETGSGGDAVGSPTTAEKLKYY